MIRTTTNPSDDLQGSLELGSCSYWLVELYGGHRFRGAALPPHRFLPRQLSSGAALFGLIPSIGVIIFSFIDDNNEQQQLQQQQQQQ
jgi:hypothetical protein